MSTDKKSFPYLLVVSLCANTLMLGAVAGMFITSNKAPHGERRDDRRAEFIGGGPIEERLARTAMRDLPEADQEKFRTELRSAWRQSREQRAEMDAIRKRIEATLAADNYDPEQMKAAFADLRARENEMKEHLHGHISDMLASIPDDKRKTLIQRTLERRDKFRERWDDRRGERGERGDRGERRPPPDDFSPDGPPPDEPPLNDEAN